MSSGSPRATRTEPHVGNAIQQRRRALSLTRSRVAQEANVSSNTLEKVEQGVIVDPGLLTIAPICQRLGLSLDSLVATIGCPTPDQGAVPSLVSLGYEGRTADELVRAAQRAGVQVLADVRLTPISRKPGLSKTKLAAALNAVGIEYVHYRSLGNPKDNRAPFWNGQAEEGRKRLRDLFGEQAWSDLRELQRQARSQVIGILCFEADEMQCHRKLVLDELRGPTPPPGNTPPRC